MIVNIKKMGTITTTTRHYIDEEPSEEFVRHRRDDEGRRYRDESKTTGFNQDFYVNTDHVVSLESVVRYDTKCTQITLSTGDKFVTMHTVGECLRILRR
jgi:hypothetical protein